ncbi:hypothetical protein LUR56_40080 [Streptomyces sp. MT29]|nr:hypothetical protein [Streptomyces sp. MT29]
MSATAGDFATPQDAQRFVDHLDKSAVNGQLTKFQQPFDFADPQLDQAARDWRSTRGENIQSAITRARTEFDGATPSAAAPKRSEDLPATNAPEEGGQRFSTLQAVRAHWQQRLDRIDEVGPESLQEQRAARNLDDLISNSRLKLVGRGQLVAGQDEDGEWYLVATANGAKIRRRWPSLRDAQDFAQSFVENPPKNRDGEPLDLSDPDTNFRTWRSADNRSISEIIDDTAERQRLAPTADASPTSPSETGGPTADNSGEPDRPTAPETALETPESAQAPPRCRTTPGRSTALRTTTTSTMAERSPSTAPTAR